MPVERLDLARVGTLSFEPPDLETTCLALARDAAFAGGTAPCILNAANEVAVHAFLGGRLRFLDIATIEAGALEACEPVPVGSFDDLYDAMAGGPSGRCVAGRAARGARLSWFLAFAGFSALIVLHEFGHFIAAKACVHARRALACSFPRSSKKQIRRRSTSGPSRWAAS